MRGRAARRGAMLGGNYDVLDRFVATLEAEEEEHAAAAERRDSDVAMQLHEAELVDETATAGELAAASSGLLAAHCISRARFDIDTWKSSQARAARPSRRRRATCPWCGGWARCAPMFDKLHFLG